MYAKRFPGAAFFDNIHILMAQSKILVSGGKGFIGRHLISHLSKKGYSVVSYEGNVTEKFDFGGPIDVVCHLAAKTFIKDCADYPAEAIKVNFGGTLNALEFARAKKAKFIFASAAAVYGLSNKGIRESETPKPNSVYGMSKYLAEQLCEFYARSFSVSCAVIRLFNVYGRGQKREFLLPTIIENVKKGTVVELRSPKSVRDYIYIDDVSALFERCIESNLPENFYLFNAGSGQGYSVMDVVNSIKSISGRNIQIKASTDAPGDIFTADISKIKKVLGWEPQISFENGLKKMLA